MDVCSYKLFLVPRALLTIIYHFKKEIVPVIQTYEVTVLIYISKVWKTWLLRDERGEVSYRVSAASKKS